jgi:glutaredoxin 3
MSEVIIYTKGTCPYCHKAKALLERQGMSYEEIRIDLEPERREEMIQKSGGRTTVPQVFIRGQHIGGCDDLHAYYNQ